MAHAYRSLEPGEQIIISSEAREDLEELDRWESISESEAKAILKRQAKESAPEPSEAAKPKTAAEKKVEKAAAEAEAKRIDALPIHVGDTVKLNEATLADVHDAPESTPEGVEKATTWRGVVETVTHDDESDTDVATFADEFPPAPIDSLELAAE